MKKKWDGGYCDRCANTGSVDCHCGGDLCVCGREEYDCPKCDGNSADPYYIHERDSLDDDDYPLSPDQQEKP